LSLICATGAQASRLLSVRPWRRPLGAAHQRLAFARMDCGDIDLLDLIGLRLLHLPTEPLDHFVPSRDADGALQPFGTDGLIHSLGTNMGERLWRNPHLSGDLVCRWSSVAELSNPSRFVSHPSELVYIHCAQTEPTFFLTDADRRLTPPDDAWMAVDLGPGRSIVLEHYALRNDGCGNDALRCWELHGAQSLNGPWTTLRIHAGPDKALAAQPYAEAIWRIDCDTAYQCFRILQRSSHGSETNYAIACAGIELYGWLRSTARTAPAG